METLFLFIIGGFGYGIIEVMWRGYTHWTMVVTGGICLLLICAVCTGFPMLHTAVRSAICAVGITAVEYVVGCVVNLRLGWNVWDYSEYIFNVRGQVCMLYTVLWFFLCLCIVPVVSYYYNL